MEYVHPANARQGAKQGVLSYCQAGCEIRGAKLLPGVTEHWTISMSCATCHRFCSHFPAIPLPGVVESYAFVETEKKDKGNKGEAERSKGPSAMRWVGERKSSRP